MEDLVQYVSDYLLQHDFDSRDISRAWGNMDRKRCPLSMADRDLYSAIESAMEDYGYDYLDGDFPEESVQEVFYELELPVSGVGILYHNSALARDNDGFGEDEMFPVKLRDVKDRFFKLSPTDSATVWVREEYDRSERKYYCRKYDGNADRYIKGDKIVYVGFYF